MRLLTPLLALLLAAHAAAEPETPASDGPVIGTIYRHVDANGKVVFTDQPPGNAQNLETVILPPVNAVKLEQRTLSRPENVEGSAGREARNKAAVAAGYQSLGINGFEDGTVLRNPEGGIVVSAAPVPALFPGDRLVIRYNGQTIDGDTYSLPTLERGTHTFSAAILREGQVLIESPAISMTVLRTTVKDQATNKPTPTPPKPKPKTN